MTGFDPSPRRCGHEEWVHGPLTPPGYSLADSRRESVPAEESLSRISTMITQYTLKQSVNAVIIKSVTDRSPTTKSRKAQTRPARSWNCTVERARTARVVSFPGRSSSIWGHLGRSLKLPTTPAVPKRRDRPVNVRTFRILSGPSGSSSNWRSGRALRCGGSWSTGSRNRPLVLTRQ